VLLAICLFYALFGRTGTNMSNLQCTINDDLGNIFNWLCMNKLSLNINKTKFMVITNKPFTNIVLSIQNHTLECVSEMKFLGIILDNKLTFKRHIHAVSNKLSSAVGVMYRIRPFMQSYTLKKIYFALIQSHLIYGILVWGQAAQSNLNRIYSLQKKAIKLIAANSSQPNVVTSIPHFNVLYKLCSVIKLYKCINTEHSPHFNEVLNSLLPNHSQYTRRNLNRFYNIPNHRCNRSQQSFIYHSTSYWNALPNSIKTADDVQKFKKAAKKYYST